MKKLSHYDKSGQPKMVDVTPKQVTARRAIAFGRVKLSKETIEVLQQAENPKGNPLEIARIAGIMAAKRTAELIPLCHSVNLGHLGIAVDLTDDGVEIRAEASTNAQTGVEMEAMTAVSIAALTIYDMCKAIQRDIEITDIRLESKTGGKSNYTRT